MPMRFFFYGTLVAGSGNAVAGRVHARLSAGVAARVSGRLYAIPDRQGWYPALVGGEDAVRGYVYEALAGFGEADLAALDHWEGAEYRRAEIAVHQEDGREITAQAYLWDGPLPAAAEAIPGGDFADFLRLRGAKAFGEEG